MPCWAPQLGYEAVQYGTLEDESDWSSTYAMPYSAGDKLDDMNFLAFGTRGTAVEPPANDLYVKPDNLRVWDSDEGDWIDVWMYDNRYYLISNATSTTLTFNGASEFETGWYVCVMNDEKAECKQITDLDGNELTVGTMSNWTSFTTDNNTFAYKFEPTRYELSSTCWTGSTTLEISATPFFEEGDEIFITHTGEEPTLEWDTIDSVSTNGGTTITLDNGFDSSYTTGNNSYIWSRPKFGRWRKVDDSNDDPWAKATTGLTDLEPERGFMMKCNKDPKQRFVVHERSTGIQ